MSSFFGGQQKSTVDSLKDALSGRQEEKSTIAELGDELSGMCPKMSYTQVRSVGCGARGLRAAMPAFDQSRNDELSRIDLMLQRFWGFGICVATGFLLSFGVRSQQLVPPPPRARS